MKPNQIILAAAAFLGSILTTSAQLTIPSDGSDGALNITADTVIDLSQAVTGTWDQNNTANAGKGVYDPEKWAVVFKYTSVNIAGFTTGSPAVLDGRKVTFINHPSHAPVVWLVQGNVTIDGILSLKGKQFPNNTVANLTPSESGPGGFREGARGPVGAGSGYGPDSSSRYAAAYGNPQIIPLIGGSGGGEGLDLNNGYDGKAGSGGGGAILIACSGNLIIRGIIDADGAGGVQGWAQGGAGGAVKLIANSVSGNGQVHAIGAPANNVEGAGVGRVRIETGTLSPALRTSPETIGTPPATPPIIWPAANAPKARVVSVDAVTAPTDPKSPLVAAADVAIQNNAPVNILIETRDFPIEGVVQLSIIPKFSKRRSVTATRISGDINLATWRVTTALPQGFVVLQARATQP